MGTSSRLAVMLDVDMLARHRTPIAAAGTPDSVLSNDGTFNKDGVRVAWELGGRYLLRYLLASQVTHFSQGTEYIPRSFLQRTHYVTPTPLSPEEAVSWLALPAPDQPRPYVVLLKPEKIGAIWGPRWVRMGGGIEYIIPPGLTADAIVDIGAVPNTKWPLLVT